MAYLRNNLGDFKKGHVPWNKGTKGLQVPWNKGMVFDKDPNAAYRKPGYKKMHEVWNNMMNRCYRESTNGYERYGGRGIEVCDSWQTFINFYNDMYPSYKKKLTIERVDNNMGYFKENCKWATWKEQCLNRKSNRHISYGGITKPLSEWANSLNINRSTLAARLDKLGWSVAKSIEKPVMVSRRNLYAR